MRAVNIGLVGCGTVGGGVVRILNVHARDFERRHGVRLRIAKATSRTKSKMLALGLTDGQIVESYRDIIADPEIDIVVELIGGTGLAADVILEALAAGKHVVTANKAVMASRGAEVFAAAQAAGAEVSFEASVGGGIPIIQPLEHALTGNRIDTVLGIVNGTTNYMLTRIGEGMSYDDALEEAQAKGFAEADPTADVDGHDAAAKIAILASIAFNSRVTIDDVVCEGIRSLAPVDLAFAEREGYAVKLLAVAHCDGGAVDVRVHPTMIPKTHPLASVDGVYNAIFAHGDSVGNVMFFGEGAGSGAAASAVMGDIIEVARHVQCGQAPIAGCSYTEELPFADFGALETRYYLRLSVADAPGVLAETSKCLGDAGVSVRSMVQQSHNAGCAQITFLTHRARERDVQQAVKALEALGSVQAVGALIRIEEG